MAFDLNTAKPVEPAGGGFDLSTAKPVDDNYGHEGNREPMSKTERKARTFRPRDDAAAFAGAGEAVKGVGELGLSALTGGIAAVPAGLAGIAHGAYRMARGDTMSEAAAKGGGTARSIQEFATYEPKTDSGKAVAHGVSLPMIAANELLSDVGEKYGPAVGLSPDAGRTIGENAIPVGLAMAGGAKTLAKPSVQAAPVAGRDYTPLRQFTMEEEQRMARQRSQGVEPTLGSVTRDPSQHRFEQQTAGTEAGRPLYQRGIENDAALTKNVTDIAEQPGPVGPNIKGNTPNQNQSDAGRALRKAAEAKKAAVGQEVDALYNKARAAGETKAMVDLDPLKKFFETHEAEALAVPELRAVKAMVDDLGKLGEKEGMPGHASINDIENVRQRVGNLAQKDGSVRKFMNQIRAGIDEMTEGQGGDLYKQARAKRRAMGVEFEEQGGVARLIDKKSDTDYRVASEDVWRDTVVKGSTDDLTNVIKTLRTTNEKQRPQALQALKDMQARTVDMITEEATKTGTVSKAGLERGIKSVGEEKLTLLLGKEGVKTLRETVMTANELKTPPLKVPGSDTKLNQAVDLERALTDHAASLFKGVLPRPLKFISGAIDGLREGAAKRAEGRHRARQIDDALTPSREDAAKIAATAAKERSGNRRMTMSDAVDRSALPTAAVAADREERP